MFEFRLFKTPVRIQPWFLLIAAWFGWMQAERESAWEVSLAIFVVVMFTGVLAHEFGHAFAGRAFGLTPRIELHGMGGVTSWEDGRRLSPGQSIAVSAAGPGVGIVIGLASGLLLIVLAPAEGSIARFAFTSLVWVNLGWGVLNLLPMMPLDGGNIMASFFELFAGSKGRIAARLLSLVFCAALLALVLSVPTGFGTMWTVLIVGWLGYINWRALSVERRIGVDLPLAVEMRQVHAELQKGNLVSARSQALELRGRARTPLMQGELSQLVAWSHLLGGDARSAADALADMPAGRSVEPALLGSVKLQNGDADGAIGPLREALGQGGKLVEDQLAEALARTGRFDEAVDVFNSPAAHRVAPETIERLEEAAYRAGRFGDAARLGEVLFDREGRAIRAFNVACSLAREGDHDAAFTWLGRARDSGLDQTDLLDSDDDLAVLRALPEWGSVRASFDA